MKVCILGDVHFGARNDSPHFAKHFEKFYKDVFFPYLWKNEIHHVIQLGDVFDRRKFVNFQTLESARAMFFEHLNKHYWSWVLIGNHDTYYKNTNDVNSLKLLLGEYKNIKIVNKPEVAVVGDTQIMLVPWICDSNYTEVMDSLQKTTAQIVCGHFEFAGFEMYRGQVCDEGMDPNLFSRFDSVISGHYHHKSSAKNITYVGTPYELMWSDFGDQKGFHILDTSTRTLEFIPNPYVMFHKILYDDLNQPITYINTWDPSNYAGCYVKLVVRNKTNTMWFDSLVDRLEKAGVADLQVVEDHYHLDLETDDDIISQAEDTLTILKKYVDQIDATVDKQKLEALLRNLYSEALSIE